MTEQSRIITEEEYKRLKEDIEILKKKLVEAKPELEKWVVINFGEIK
jgi:hypothetical protein